jgi:fructokinase
VLCLGEALVDLVSEAHVDDVALASSFVPRVGGSGAVVAAVAARLGAPMALAGTAGSDSWGRWLRAQMSEAGVDVSWFGLVPDVQTTLAVVAVGADGSPQSTVYGDSVVFAGDDLERAVGSAAALFISLGGPAEREIVMRARSLALEAGLPVVFDPNVRVDRWRSQADAAASANACVPGAVLVRADLDEAVLLTGEEDPERAALALVKAGARLVVVSLGAEGAILRGELRLDIDGVPADVVSRLGAGDVLSGTLLARLALSDFYVPAVAASLREAVAAAARACERWGALD